MHSLICGRTESGKSTLAKELGSELRLASEEVLAFNPIGDPGYTRRDDHGRAGAEWETTDPDEFAAEVARRCARPKRRFVIVDEAHEFFTRSDCAHLWIGTRGRHHGINLIAITQRAALLHPTVRGQCATLYLFQCTLTDARFLGDEYGNAELAEASGLAPGQYLKICRGVLTRGRVWE